MVRGSVNVVSGVIIAVTVVLAIFITGAGRSPGGGLVVLLIGAIASTSPRIVKEWERAVLLRLGKFQRVLNPGLVWVIPGVEQVTSLVDMRIRSTTFSAEKTLTKDTVPVDVDAVLFWVVTDAKKSILEVKTYETTITWAAQTTLRDVIGRTELVRMISDRQNLDHELQSIIDTKTSEWGITVQSVEIRDVRIPGALEDAMSRKAQADREKAARVILAESEVLVAQEMMKAANIYEEKKIAMQLRAMNMTYESIKERGALMVLPSGMADSMNTGVLGMASMGFRTASDLPGANLPGGENS